MAESRICYADVLTKRCCRRSHVYNACAQSVAKSTGYLVYNLVATPSFSFIRPPPITMFTTRVFSVSTLIKHPDSSARVTPHDPRATRLGWSVERKKWSEQHLMDDGYL